jgi:hypothetical protein
MPFLIVTDVGFLVIGGLIWAIRHKSAKGPDAEVAAFWEGLFYGAIVWITLGIIVAVVGVPERYNLIASKDSTDISSEIIEYFEEEEEKEPIPITEVEPPILQSDGFYKINVSSLKWKNN